MIQIPTAPAGLVVSLDPVKLQSPMSFQRFFSQKHLDAGFSFSLFRREGGRTGHRAKWLRESFAGRDRAK